MTMLPIWEMEKNTSLTVIQVRITQNAIHLFVLVQIEIQQGCGGGVDAAAPC